MVIRCGLCILLAWSAMGGPDENASVDDQQKAWAQLRGLVGSWEGKGEGTPGVSEVERSYELIVGGKFLLARNLSVFEARNGKESERHEDWAIYSFDESRKCIVLREFHSEGYVNRYSAQEVGDGGKTMVFVTEAVENGPPKLSARMTVTLAGDNHLEEAFELDFTGRGFSPCVNVNLRRVSR